MSQIKGVYNATPPTVRDGQNEDIQLNVNGDMKVELNTGGVALSSAANTDRTTATKVIPVQHIDATGIVGGVTLNTALDNVDQNGVEIDKIGVSPTRRSDAFQATITSANATSSTVVKAKTAAKRIYVTDLIISVDTAMNVQLQDDAGSPAVLMEQVYVPANSVFSKVFSTPLMLAVNQDLRVITSASGNISVTVLGYII